MGEKLRRKTWEVELTDVKGPDPVGMHGRKIYRMSVEGIILHGSRDTVVEAEAQGQRVNQTRRRVFDKALKQAISFAQEGISKPLSENEIKIIERSFEPYFDLSSKD